jgi:hypothetical protein
MHCIEGVITNCDLLFNWVGIHLYLVIANKILTNFISEREMCTWAISIIVLVIRCPTHCLEPIYAK